MKSPTIHRVPAGSRIDATDTAIGLRRASKTKKMRAKTLCFSVVEIREKRSYIVEIFRKIFVQVYM